MNSEQVSNDQLTRERVLALRQKYVATDQDAYVVATYGKYAKMPVFLDVSHWNAVLKNGVYVPVTDWKYLASKPEFFGAYVKIGEAFGGKASGSLESDLYFDIQADAHTNGLYQVGGWIGWYIMYEPGWATNRGIHRGGVEAMFSGSSDDTIAGQLLQDTNTYIFVRKIKRGFGRAVLPSADAGRRMKACENNTVDCLVIDLEKYWNSRSETVSDNEIGFMLGKTLAGLRWLMAHGYLPEIEIWIYTSGWFLNEYGNLYTRNVVDHEKTIMAGYWWGDGTKVVTWEELMADLATIRDDWHPAYAGAEVCGLQISGDYHKMFGTKIDVNVSKLSWEELARRFPAWKARKEAGAPLPPPTEPPAEVKTYAKVLVDRLRMREGAGTGAEIAGFMAKDAEVEILETVSANGITWGRIDGWMAIDAAYCRVRKE